MVRFVTIYRRGGEAIPINPELVAYMRQSGSLTSIFLADGSSFRVEVPSADLVEAFSKGGDKVEVKEPAKAPPEALPAAPEALGASGAQLTPNPAATPPGEAHEAEADLTEEEEAELQGRAQRAQEADAGEKAKGASNQHASKK